MTIFSVSGVLKQRRQSQNHSSHVDGRRDFAWTWSGWPLVHSFESQSLCFHRIKFEERQSPTVESVWASDLHICCFFWYVFDQSRKGGLNYRLPATSLPISDDLRDQGSLRLRLTVACPTEKNVIVA